MVNSSTVRDTQFEEILRVIKKEDLMGEELTAREILELVEENGGDASSPHEIATILGYHTDRPGIKVIKDSPYRYKFY